MPIVKDRELRGRQMAEHKRRCLNPSHQNIDARARGLCVSCYNSAFYLVKYGRTTWEKLETSGRVSKKRYGVTSAWLLGK